MKKTTILFAILTVVSAITLSFANKKPADIAKEVASVKTEVAVEKNSNIEVDPGTSVASLVSSLSEKLNFQKLGLKTVAVETAVKGYLKLQEQGKLNSDLLTIIDMSQSGRQKRFYLIDMKEQKLLVNTYVSHGNGSGLDMARDFSNVPESNKTSLGFYVTRNTYTGKHGTSLRLEGVDRGFNDNAMRRAIVVHGADYVNAGRVNSAYMGRSQGCPALPMNMYKQVINLIKDGSAMFIYYPDAKYMNNSDILNG